MWRPALLLVAAGLPATASAQTFPVVPGTLEIQAGIAGIVLPEAVDGTYSAQPELRVGLFLAEGLELQVQADVRIWPLGDVAPRNVGAAGHLAWFPRLGPRNRNLYLLGGAGLARSDPSEGIGGETSLDPFARGGFGYKVALPGVNVGFLPNAHLTAEYRFEILFADETDLVSGGLLALSMFR